ncbi:WD40 repeat-like protein [Neoconidiobolus thromboides FSU 785]|nr:WD40 repeat-like protein [Neoconidiobolus thromboides FSU 785]
MPNNSTYIIPDNPYHNADSNSFSNNRSGDAQSNANGHANGIIDINGTQRNGVNGGYVNGIANALNHQYAINLPQSIADTYYVPEYNNNTIYGDFTNQQANTENSLENQDIKEEINESGPTSEIVFNLNNDYVYYDEANHYSYLRSQQQYSFSSKFDFPNFGTSNRQSLNRHRDVIEKVAWNYNGTFLATYSRDKTLLLWESTGTSGLSYAKELKGLSHGVELMAWDLNNQHRLATLSNDKTLRVWNTQNSEVVKLVKISFDGIDMAWCPIQDMIAIAAKDGTVAFIDVEKSKIEKEFTHKSHITRLRWNHNGNFLLIATVQGYISIHSFPNLQFVYTLPAANSIITSLEIDQFGKHLAVGCVDGNICIWDIQNMICTGSLFYGSYPVKNLSFSHCGKLLAFACQNTEIALYDISASDIIHEVSGSQAPYSLAWHPRQFTLAYTSSTTGDNDSSRYALNLLGA